MIAIHSLAWGRGWHQDKEAQGLSSVLVHSNNLLCLLSTPSTTYTHALSLKNTDLFCSSMLVFVCMFMTMIAVKYVNIGICNININWRIFANNNKQKYIRVYFDILTMGSHFTFNLCAVLYFLNIYL